MNFLTIVLLIVIGVIGGYILGLVDSKFTHTLVDTITKARNSKTVLRVVRSKNEQLELEVNGRVVGNAIDLKGDEKEMLIAIRDRLESIAKPSVANTKLNSEVPTTLFESPQHLPPQADNISATLVHKSLNQSTKELPKRPQTLVEMINDEISKRTEGTNLSSQKIRIESRSDDSIVYFFGSVPYDTIEKIPDKDARDLIKRTIKDWQDR